MFQLQESAIEAPVEIDRDRDLETDVTADPGLVLARLVAMIEVAEVETIEVETTEVEAEAFETTTEVVDAALKEEIA